MCYTYISVRMKQENDGKKLGAQLAMELVSDKWTILIIHALKPGKKRYSQLQRELIGVSQRMLIFTLRNMERDGLITRTVYPVVPPKTEYALTPLGETLWEPLHHLCLWAEQYFDQVLECRRSKEAASTD
jgi:DNA-binding HxlR family transcriptional regulator